MGRLDCNFEDWQDRVGFERAWLGDFNLDVLFDWDRAGDVIEFGDLAGRPKWERAMQVPQQNMRDAMITRSPFRATPNSPPSNNSATSGQCSHRVRPLRRGPHHGRRTAPRLADGLPPHDLLRSARTPRGAEAPRAQRPGRRPPAWCLQPPHAHWLDFFCYTMFVDRDGKFQLGMLSTSGFKPSRPPWARC